VSVGFGFGGYGRYGWLPCGPGDWYRPWYGRWGNRVNVVNVTNIHNTTIVNNYNNGFAPLAGHRRSRFSNLDEAFHNDRVRSGISSMPGHEFGRGAVSPHQERISESSFRQAGLVNGRMPVTPSRESFSPSGRAADPSAFRHAPPSTQRFFSGSATRPMTNPQATRSFANANGAGVQGQSPAEPNRNLRPFGRPSAQASSQTVPRAPSPTVNANRANSPAATQPSRPGWRTFTPPASAGANRSAQGSDANRQATPNNPDRGTFTPPSRPSSPAPFQGTAPRMPAGAQPENRGSWQHFTPPPRQSQPQESNRGFAQPGPAPQREFRPPAQAPHGNVPNSSTNSRPPLDMRQPIVRPRGGSYGSGAPQGSNSQPRGGYTAPRGGSSAPQGGGNRGGGGGRSGGGNSQGGGSGGGRQR
jgi:translation initiation factor IF-2